VKYDAPFDGGALVLFFDNSVQWAQKKKPEDRWIRTNLAAVHGQTHSPGSRQTNFVTYGYIPNPRMDEDQDYDQNDEDLATDNDDIYVIECDTDGVPIDQSNDDGSQYGDVPGWLNPVGEWHPGVTPWRTYMNTGTQFDGNRGTYEPDPNDISYSAGWANTIERKVGVCGFDYNWGKHMSFLAGSQWQFPQRGPYAGEIRWSKHDTRLVCGPPFYRGGGPGTEVDDVNRYGFPEQ
jgi:hypothetical protein